MTVETTSCPHRQSDVVIPAGSTEVVARICTTCFADLPANWGCAECEWAEVHELGGMVWIFCEQPCDDHKGGL